MKRIVIVASAVMLANVVGVERVAMPLGAQDRVAEVLAQAKKALGGDRLAAVKALSAEGPFRRAMGQRDMEGTITLVLVRPDKMRRIEDMNPGGMVGGPTIERTTAFNGTEAWEDMQNRGAMGGNFRIEMRGPGDGPPPGSPAGQGAGQQASVLTPEQIEQARVRRAKTELQRWSIAFFAESAAPFTDAGVAESPDGKADVLETKDESGRVVRFFIDQSTHLPLMVQYLEIRPRVMISGPGPGGRGGRGGPGGAPGGSGAPGAGAGERPSQQEIQRRIEEMRKQGPPQASQFALHLGEYKKVDGVMLPHKLDVSIDGEPNEEWTIEKFRINPSVKAEDFEKPKK
jgi:hypothetical protein